MSLIEQLRSSLNGGRKSAQPDSETLYTTPWEWRDENSMYIGHNGQVWLYRTLPVSPLEWEDASTRVSLGNQIASMLATIGGTGSTPVPGMRLGADLREIHLLSLSWDTPATPPKANPSALASYQQQALGFLVTQRALMIGVRLRPSTPTRTSGRGVGDQLRGAVTRLLAEDVPDRTEYQADAELIGGLLARFGATKPNREQTNQLESWYNQGRGPDALIVERATSLEVGGIEDLEFSAVMAFDRPVLHAPNSQWALEALVHQDAPKVVSIRAVVEPNAIARARARRSQRRVNAAIEEETATQDLERLEFSQAFSLAKEFETYLFDAGEPILSSCSLLMARSIEARNETYLDHLETRFGIQMKPLEHRQMGALDETLPTSSRRLNPFVHDLTINMLAFSGINGFSAIGDTKGAYLGLADPDGTPVFLEFLGAPRNNKPPVCGVFGDPGSGKTYLGQSLAVQAVLAGLNTIFINPKGMDSLSPTAELVGGTVVKMSALEKEPGAFDPFLYAPPQVAAEIATGHILSVLESGFTQEQRLALGHGLKKAALAGVSCVGEALEYVEDPTVTRQIAQQVEASSLFALGIAVNQRPRFGATSGLTLIEFDRKLDLPDPGKDARAYTSNERIALAAMRLVTRASLEILALSGGGALMLDEAWTFLSHSEGMSAITQLAREGRSLNLLPVFITQRIADVVNQDLEGYLSRVFVMQTTDEKDARVALRLCGLEATDSRIEWLRTIGPTRGTEDSPGRWAMALHRDLAGRHSAIALGPTPAQAAEAFSTNPEDRANREAARAAQAHAQDGSMTPATAGHSPTG